jgi:hypothetical protein
MISIIDAMSDVNLFGPWVSGSSWDSWRTFLKSLFALPLTKAERALYEQCTGRSTRPREPARESWLICGRRSGKSFISALVAVYLACFRSYEQYLTAGERGVVMIIASDRRQAKIIFGYIVALLEGIPLLAQMIERRTAESVALSNSIVLEVHTASFRSTRGYSILAAILDEVAFWRVEGSASPDSEIIAAVRPGMAAVPGSLLLALSSPYAQRGALWAAYRKHWAKADDPVLVWQAPSLLMNPTLDTTVIHQAFEEDPVTAATEWNAIFRSDLEALFRREVVEGLVIPGRYELPPQPNTQYVGFVDPSGGSADAMTLCIAHGEQGRAVLDCLRVRRPPFDPDITVREFSETLKQYGLYQVSGDKYGGAWPSERFRAHGVNYAPSTRTKSEIYLESVARLNSGQVELLDDPRLVAERRTGHPPRQRHRGSPTGGA